MRRRYYHALAVYDGERLRCEECGAELGWDTLGEVPCRVPAASVLENEGVCWHIDVWDCTARLAAYRAADGRYLRVEVDEDVAGEVEEFVYRAVEEQGAVTMSGMYSVPDGPLAEYIASGKVRAV